MKLESLVEGYCYTSTTIVMRRRLLMDCITALDNQLSRQERKRQLTSQYMLDGATDGSIQWFVHKTPSQTLTANEYQDRPLGQLIHPTGTFFSNLLLWFQVRILSVKLHQTSSVLPCHSIYVYTEKAHCHCEVCHGGEGNGMHHSDLNLTRSHKTVHLQHAA